jgi:hypothetical protein
MTTISMNNVAANNFFAATRANAKSPAKSFAARLAQLQAVRENELDTDALFATFGRLALAAIPVAALAGLFVFV